MTEGPRELCGLVHAALEGGEFGALPDLLRALLQRLEASDARGLTEAVEGNAVLLLLEVMEEPGVADEAKKLALDGLQTLRFKPESGGACARALGALGDLKGRVMRLLPLHPWAVVGLARFAGRIVERFPEIRAALKDAGAIDGLLHALDAAPSGSETVNWIVRVDLLILSILLTGDQAGTNRAVTAGIIPLALKQTETTAIGHVLRLLSSVTKHNSDAVNTADPLPSIRTYLGALPSTEIGDGLTILASAVVRLLSRYPDRPRALTTVLPLVAEAISHFLQPEQPSSARRPAEQLLGMVHDLVQSSHHATVSFCFCLLRSGLAKSDIWKAVPPGQQGGWLLTLLSQAMGATELRMTILLGGGPAMKDSLLLLACSVTAGELADPPSEGLRTAAHQLLHDPESAPALTLLMLRDGPDGQLACRALAKMLRKQPHGQQDDQPAEGRPPKRQRLSGDLFNQPLPGTLCLVVGGREFYGCSAVLSSWSQTLRQAFGGVSRQDYSLQPIPLPGPDSIPEDQLYSLFLACMEHGHVGWVEGLEVGGRVNPVALAECARWLQMPEARRDALAAIEKSLRRAEVEDAAEYAALLRRVVAMDMEEAESREGVAESLVRWADKEEVREVLRDCAGGRCEDPDESCQRWRKAVEGAIVRIAK